jgi:hypothetical protein
MDQTDEQLIEQLKGSLAAQGMATAFEDADSATPEPQAPSDNPLDTDFFRALNAFRAARHGGDPAAIAAAEDALRDVVRAEIVDSCS